jgi:hypothetical protein
MTKTIQFDVCIELPENARPNTPDASAMMLAEIIRHRIPYLCGVYGGGAQVTVTPVHQLQPKENKQ